MLILTGQRRDEIADLRRSEITESAIELPGERTKNKRQHVVPLSAQAEAIIDEPLAAANRATVFGSRFDGFSGFSKSKAKLDAKLPRMAPWQLHDIRRSVATGMAELGIEPHIIEAILNHVSGHRSGVAGVYNKATYLEAKTKALELWAQHIGVIVAQASGANIILHPARSGTFTRRGNQRT